MSRARRRLVLGAAVAIAVAIAATALLWPSGSKSSSVAVGRQPLLLAPAKRKRLPLVIGRVLEPPPTVLSLRASRPQFIDVWASWCVPCREEAPALAHLWRRYGSRVRFLGIDVEDTRSAAKRFARRFRLGYPSVFDADAALAGRLGFFGLPTAYLVDRRGRVALTFVGKQSAARFKTALAELVADDRRVAARERSG